MTDLILHLVKTYLIVGILCAIFSDITIRQSKTSEPCSFFEIFTFIFFWPFILGIIVVNFFNQD